MYLHRKVYVGNKWRKPEQKLKVKYPDTEEGVSFPVGKDINEDKISEIVEEAAYWRKANQIHNWFVQNVQGGEDDCKEYYVDHEQLEELVNTCKKVLESSELVKGKVKNGATMTKDGWEDILEDGELIVDSSVAQELLPTGSGFFFGSTEYDQYYVDDLKETIKQLEPLVEKDEEGHYVNKGEFYYQSSW